MARGAGVKLQANPLGVEWVVMRRRVQRLNQAAGDADAATKPANLARDALPLTGRPWAAAVAVLEVVLLRPARPRRPSPGPLHQRTSTPAHQRTTATATARHLHSDKRPKPTDGTWAAQPAVRT